MKNLILDGFTLMIIPIHGGRDWGVRYVRRAAPIRRFVGSNWNEIAFWLCSICFETGYGLFVHSGQQFGIEGFSIAFCRYEESQGT